MLFMYSYNMGSEGATNLARELGIRKIRHENSKFKGGLNKTVINWGSSNLPPEVMKSKVINDPKAVAIAANKLSFFQAVKDKVSIPPFTTDLQEAIKWTADNFIVCARQKLTGSGAEGLVLMDRNNPDSFVKAPLYTQYIPKIDEYRIHVVNKAVTDVQRKALRSSWSEENPGKTPNFKIRNLENGFIYMRENIKAPPSVIDEAVKAVVSTGLHFGAVDVIYNHRHSKAYVLEVNCAPGVEGTSIKNYAAAFTDLVKEMK